MSTSMPFWVSQDESGVYFLNHNTELVRLVFERFNAGLSIRQIVRELQQASAISSSGVSWNRHSVLSVLRSKAAVGEFVAVEDYFPAAVLREKWDLAQVKLHERANKFTSRKTS